MPKQVASLTKRWSKSALNMLYWFWESINRTVDNRHAFTRRNIIMELFILTGDRFPVSLFIIDEVDDDNLIKIFETKTPIEFQKLIQKLVRTGLTLRSALKMYKKNVDSI